jgi:hypothetical protein
MMKLAHRIGRLIVRVACVAQVWHTCVAQTTPNPPASVCIDGACSHDPPAADLLHPSASDPCLPFSMPTNDEIFIANRKVFAHYFDVLPLSMDNKPANSDYYSSTWLVALRGNMWYPNGGFLRTRPIGVSPAPASQNYKVRNFEIEIRTAIARGITGWTYDIGKISEIESGGNLDNMLKAVAAVDARFKIVLMVDHLSPSDVMTVVKATYNNPVVYRYSGKVVVAPYMANTVSPEDWATMKTALANQGYPIYFMPTFLSLPPDIIAAYGKVADAFGLFGTPQVPQGAAEAANIARVRAAGKYYMSGLSPQGYRPKVYRYWETQGSLGYRNGWMAVVEGLPEWVQLATWNDLSETTQVSPYTDLQGSSGSGFFDLTGYYASWYITGRQPTITHDVLYYFYRKQPVNAASPNAGQPTIAVTEHRQGADVIELVAFLTAPGTLSITAGGKTYTSNVGAGMQSFTVPLAPGAPVFSLTRDGKVLVSVSGDVSVAGLSGLPGGFPDYTYWTGSASSSGTCSMNGVLN